MESTETKTPEIVYSRLFEHPTLDMLLNETPVIVIDSTSGERLAPTPSALSREELEIRSAALQYRLYGAAMVSQYVPKPRRSFLTAVA